MCFWTSFIIEMESYHRGVLEERHILFKILGLLGYPFLPIAAAVNAYVLSDFVGHREVATEKLFAESVRK